MNARTQDDINGLAKAGLAVREAFDAMVDATVAGVTTMQLDQIGAQVLKRWGAMSAPQLYYDFPGTTCISVNEEAAHGIPSGRRLCAGDMVNIDVSANLGGYVADMGESFTVGAPSAEQARLIAAVKEAVDAAISQVKGGRSLNVIGRAVQAIADRDGYQIVQNLGSHGVGRSIHEEPSYIPYDNPSEERKLTRGMVLTIEPFFATGASWVDEGEDGWTLSVPRGTMVAQYEHTLIVTDHGAVVVTQ